MGGLYLKIKDIVGELLGQKKTEKNFLNNAPIELKIRKIKEPRDPFLGLEKIFRCFFDGEISFSRLFFFVFLRLVRAKMTGI